MTTGTPVASAGALLAAFAAAAMIFAVTRILGNASASGHAQSRRRLAGITGGAASAAGTAAAAPDMLRARRGPAVPALRAWIARAGLQWEPIDLLMLTAISAVASGGAVALLTRVWLVAFLASLAGALAPWFLIRRKAAQRNALLNEQVVDTVELVASSLRAGFGVVQSLELASREQPEPMAGELRRVVREIHLGGNTEEALERFEARAGDVDLTLVVTAVLVQRRVGGDLAEILLNLAGTIRDRIRVRGEVQALTAQARMSAWVVGLLPVGLAAALFVLSPDQIRLLLTDPAGRLIAGGALMLELVGFGLVQRIAKIDY